MQDEITLRRAISNAWERVRPRAIVGVPAGGDHDGVQGITIRLREAPLTGEPLVVAGFDSATGRGQSVIVDPEELSAAIQPTLDAILASLSSCLDELPPRTIDDIMSDGIITFGGGSLLAGFGQRLEEEFGFRGSSCRPTDDLLG